MASKISLFTVLFISSFAVNGQYKDYYVEGNEYMNKRQFELAEETYAEGIEFDTSMHVLYPRLANAMTMQQKFNPADSVLDVVLKKRPNYVEALWFKGLNYFYWDQDSMAVIYFKKFLNFANPANHQVANAYYYIGRSYENMLTKDGLTQGDLSDMINYYQKFIDVAEGHPLVAKKKQLIEQVNAAKPLTYSGKWKWIAPKKD